MFHKKCNQDITRDRLCSIDSPLFISLIFPHISSLHELQHILSTYNATRNFHQDLQTTLLPDCVVCSPWIIVLDRSNTGLWSPPTLATTFLSPSFISFTLSRSSLPIVFEREKENLDLLNDIRCRLSLVKLFKTNLY